MRVPSSDSDPRFYTKAPIKKEHLTLFTDLLDALEKQHRFVHVNS